MTTLAGSGQRRRIEIDGEHYYIILTWDDGAASIDITCPRENAPENTHLRAVLETRLPGWASPFRFYVMAKTG